MATHTEPRPTMIVTGEPDYDTAYIRTISGILKLVEAGLDIIVLICASVWGSIGGWIIFVAISTFINTMIMLVFHCLNLFNNYTGLFFVEFISYIVMSLFYFVCVILAIIYAAQYAIGSIIATCFFCIVAMIVYASDTYMHYVGWKQSRSATYSHTQTSNL